MLFIYGVIFPITVIGGGLLLIAQHISFTRFKRNELSLVYNIQIDTIKKTYHALSYKYDMKKYPILKGVMSSFIDAYGKKDLDLNKIRFKEKKNNNFKKTFIKSICLKNEIDSLNKNNGQEMVELFEKLRELQGDILQNSNPLFNKYINIKIKYLCKREINKILKEGNNLEREKNALLANENEAEKNEYYFNLSMLGRQFF